MPSLRLCSVKTPAEVYWGHNTHIVYNSRNLLDFLLRDRSLPSRAVLRCCSIAFANASCALKIGPTHFYARKQNASRVFAIVWACVRLSVGRSVRPSVTVVSCIKTVQARITKSSRWTAPRSLVYRDKISCHWVQGFPSNEGVEEGHPSKKTSFCLYWLE